MCKNTEHINCWFGVSWSNSDFRDSFSLLYTMNRGDSDGYICQIEKEGTFIFIFHLKRQISFQESRISFFVVENSVQNITFNYIWLIFLIARYSKVINHQFIKFLEFIIFLENEKKKNYAYSKETKATNIFETILQMSLDNVQNELKKIKYLYWRSSNWQWNLQTKIDVSKLGKLLKFLENTHL